MKKRRKKLKKKAEEEAKKKAEEKMKQNLSDVPFSVLMRMNGSVTIETLKGLAKSFLDLKECLGASYKSQITELLKRYLSELVNKHEGLSASQWESLFLNIVDVTAEKGDGNPYFRYWLNGQPNEIKLTHDKGVLLGDLVDFSKIENGCPSALGCNFSDGYRAYDAVFRNIKLPWGVGGVIKRLFPKKGEKNVNLNSIPLPWDKLAKCKNAFLNYDVLTCFSKLTILVKYKQGKQ